MVAARDQFAAVGQADPVRGLDRRPVLQDLRVDVANAVRAVLTANHDVTNGKVREPLVRPLASRIGVSPLGNIAGMRASPYGLIVHRNGTCDASGTRLITVFARTS